MFSINVSNIDNDMKGMFSALWGCMFLWLMVDKTSVKRLWKKLFFKSFSVVGSQVWDGNYMITVKVLLLIEEEVSALFSGFGSTLAWTCEFSKYLKLQGTQNWSAGFWTGSNGNLWRDNSPLNKRFARYVYEGQCRKTIQLFQYLQVHDSRQVHFHSNA
jgi:hypothetical protein